LEGINCLANLSLFFKLIYLYGDFDGLFFCGILWLGDLDLERDCLDLDGVLLFPGECLKTLGGFAILFSGDQLTGGF